MSHYFVLKRDATSPDYVFTTRGRILLTFDVNEAEFYETPEAATLALQAPELASFTAVEIEEA